MRTPTSVAAATGGISAGEVTPSEGVNGVAGGESQVSTTALGRFESEEDDGPGRIVREKEHPAKPMTIDQALFEMELVGHDFYLFADADRGQPSVVYRRKGYDYGVIRLTS